MRKRPHDDTAFTILVVEDSNEDFEVTSLAFRRAEYVRPLARCVTGDEALEYLSAAAPERPRPRIILLDLNLPGTDGREVLRIIKRRQELREIPVVVLTTSLDQRDIHSCYHDGANSYIHKPVDIHGFMEAIARLKHYWIETVVLPPKDTGSGGVAT